VLTASCGDAPRSTIPRATVPWPVTEVHHSKSKSSIRCLPMRRAPFVDRQLGVPETWVGLVGWRFDSASQRDWKVEVGHELHSAERLGFLDVLLRRLARARSAAATRRSDDPWHQILLSELAPSTAARYFLGTGWTFSGWEPKVKVGDVDVELFAPSGARVSIQVKAPGGDNAQHVLASIEKGRRQLEGARQPTMLVVSAQRGLHLAPNPESVATFLVGMTTQIGSTVVQASDDLGCFTCPAWRHVGAVVLLDHLRGLDRQLYTCTVLLNSWADAAVRCQREWFPRARVCWCDGNAIHWQAGPPVGEIYETARITSPWWRAPRPAKTVAA
jgi:hypothetical protein